MDSEFMIRESIWQTEGNGELRCGNDTVPCSFGLVRLVNGKLRVHALIDERSSLRVEESTRQARLQCEIVGRDAKGAGIQIYKIDTNGFVDDLRRQQSTLVGYAESAEYRRSNNLDIRFVEADLTGFRITTTASLAFRVGKNQVSLLRRQWKQHNSLVEHSYAYDHTMIDSTLRIELGPESDLSEIRQVCENVAGLLAVANRGYVFIAGWHLFDNDNNLVVSTFKVPPFQLRGGPQPLIETSALPAFVEQSYLPFVDQYQTWNLSSALDHYWQAMSTRSAWPMALSILVAMESLVSAFEKNHPRGNKDKTYVPRNAFKANSTLKSDIIHRLAEDFPRFDNLTQSERQYLESQILRLNGRPWTFPEKTKEMLQSLQVDYDHKQTKSLTDIRNTVVHTGTGVSTELHGDEFQNGTTSAWEKVSDTIRLFETALLSILEYQGKRSPLIFTR